MALGPVDTTTGHDVAWNALWEIEENALMRSGGSGNIRSTVYSVVLSSDQLQIGAPRAYFSSTIASNPWCINGNSYALLKPDIPDPVVTNASHVGDVPWIITRTFNDQDRLDADRTLKAYQYPHAVWGYGTTSSTMQPYRMQPDPYTANRKALGSVVVSDPFSQRGASVVTLTLDPTGPDRYQSSPLPGGGAIFGCAQPWVFDGSIAFEAAFVTRPYLVEYTQNTGGSLHLDDPLDDSAHHFFKFIYEHVDDRGRVTRSPVSETYIMKVTAAGSSLLLRLSSLFWTARKADSVLVKAYMSTDNENFVLAGSGVCPTKTASSTPMDAYINITGYPSNGSPTIYTQDGSLESGYPQLASHVVRWNNRIWIADENDITYSHPFLEGEQVSFPDTFTESVDFEVSAITPLDDRILCFSDEKVLYRTGEGPALNGQSSSYNNWAYITHEVGCTNSRSVFHALIGVFFQSRRGLELMGADGNIVHQRAVEQYFFPGAKQGSGDTIVGNLSLPRDHQARILYRKGGGSELFQLVLDYSTGTWSRWYGGTAYTKWYADQHCYYGDITSVGNTVYIVDVSGWLYQETPGRLYDNVIPVSGPPVHYHINWSVQGPWIKVDGLQGFQRVWRTAVLFKCQQWTSPPYSDAPNPELGMSVTLSADYGNAVEEHPNKSIVELQQIRDPSSGAAQLTLGHGRQCQQCSSYQVRLSSLDTNSWSYQADVSGVTELLGLWSELGIEPGTGRGSRWSRI